MEDIESCDKDQEIKNLRCKIEENKIMLTWDWPKDLHIVYVHKIKEKDAEKVSDLDKKRVRLYTREEYKNKGCYFEAIEEIDEFIYTVYPCLEERGKIQILEQNNNENKIRMCTGQKIIKYKIKEKSKLFSTKKRVTVFIELEVELDKNILCYVIKKGAFPSNKEDGTVFYFPSSLKAGKNEMAEILIEKEEQLRLFFTKEDYKKNYRLIPI